VLHAQDADDTAIAQLHRHAEPRAHARIVAKVHDLDVGVPVDFAVEIGEMERAALPDDIPLQAVRHRPDQIIDIDLPRRDTVRQHVHLRGRIVHGCYKRVERNRSPKRVVGFSEYVLEILMQICRAAQPYQRFFFGVRAAFERCRAPAVQDRPKRRCQRLSVALLVGRFPAQQTDAFPTRLHRNCARTRAGIRLRVRRDPVVERCLIGDGNPSIRGRWR
jgi:hypothetical protein